MKTAAALMLLALAGCEIHTSADYHIHCIRGVEYVAPVRGGITPLVDAAGRVRTCTGARSTLGRELEPSSSPRLQLEPAGR